MISYNLLIDYCVHEFSVCNEVKTFNIYIFIHHQDGSTVDIRRLNKIYNVTKKQRMKQSSPNAHAMRHTNRLA